MTTTRYFIAKLALAFGISRKQRRMAEAASESHLLREAEQILGQRVWKNVEGIEELGIEYWNLRRLAGEREKLLAEYSESESVLAEAHDQRAELLGSNTGGQEEFEERRRTLHSELELLARQRDGIVARAREIRRVYDGLKAKLDVLREEQVSEAAVVDTTRSRMEQLRADFDDLKQQRDQIARQIDEGTHEIEGVEKALEEARKTHREEAAEAFQVIGEANRRMSTIKARMGLIDTEMQQLYGEIGRHVSRNVSLSAQCRDAVREHRPMVGVMEALRKSITLNHRLAGL